MDQYSDNDESENCHDHDSDDESENYYDHDSDDESENCHDHDFDDERENYHDHDSDDKSENYHDHDSDEEYILPNFFEQIYNCCPLSTIPEKSHLNSGDRIIMPLSALDRLMSINIDFPMLFQIQNPSADRVSHCGVLEFTAEEGFVYLPDWMMKNMKLRDGERISMKNLKLPKGTSMKLQPHTTDFTGIQDPKEALETALMKFSCLSIGDTIMITHESKEFYIDIVETQPSLAINIIDTDCEVDFATPLDYEEPKKPKPALLVDQEKATVKEVMEFKPFCGVARRLVGKKLETTEMDEESGVVSSDSSSSEASRPCLGARVRPGKVVFGSDVSQMIKKSAKIEKEDVEVEKMVKIEEPKFQAFTGNKYSLPG